MNIKTIISSIITKALRPLKSFNIENRAQRVISKEKPVAAPTFAQNVQDIKRALESDPNLADKLDKKDVDLDGRLKDVYVTSEGRPEDDVTKELKRSKRMLPLDKNMPENYDFGFKEPDKIPYGRTTLRHLINFVSSHQADPKEITAARIAFEYKMKEEHVENILKYFKTFEIYIPETPTTKARFAGPAIYRQLAEEEKKRLEMQKDKEENDKKQKS